MLLINDDTIKPIKKMHVENNEYIIYIQYNKETEFKGQQIVKTEIDSRFCKANKKGDITISFNGLKIKSNINLIPNN